MAASTKWRLLSLANDGGQTGLAEIEMATTIGGANECTGGTADTSTTYGGGYGPANAFDGSYADYPCWFGPGGTGSWISYEFATAKDIVEFRVRGSNQEWAGCPRIMAFQYFDGSVWVTSWFGLYGGVNCGDWTTGAVIAFSKPAIGGAARYWAIQNTIGAGGNLDTVIVEMEFHGTIGGADLTANDPTKSFGHRWENGSYPVQQAFDNNSGTLSYTNDGGKQSMIGYDFDTAVDIAEIVVTGDPASGNLSRAPGNGFVLRSNDKRSWEFVTPYSKVVADYVANVATIAVGAGGGGATRRRQATIVT